ncbi:MULTISPECIES: hypothetical protein [unclassified Streptomyces]|uniref:hypothetical protein n=1 Tax=unclassified Streptomyces TaxID=2593676 RepID=UPI002E327CFB|nr:MULTISPECIES: hypothetical protein [unclassified Streptomyces]
MRGSPAARPPSRTYRPTRTSRSCAASRTARLEHGADVALFVTTCRAFTKAALGLALGQDIVALHRDLLGSWVKGAHLETLSPLNGSGGGTRLRPSA